MLPRPVPGLVVRYSYLWLDEHRRGREEGVKDRPCAIVLGSASTIPRASPFSRANDGTPVQRKASATSVST